MNENLAVVYPSILSDQERQARLMELELAIQYFPGLQPPQIMFITDQAGPDCKPDDRTIKLNSRLMDEEPKLRRAITHCLVHLGSKEQSHSDAFLAYEESLGLEPTSTDLICTGGPQPEKVPEMIASLRGLLLQALADLEKDEALRPKVRALWPLILKLKALVDIPEETAQRRIAAAVPAAESVPHARPPSAPKPNGRPRCPDCQSRMGYVRSSTDEWVCRCCGKASRMLVNLQGGFPNG